MAIVVIGGQASGVGKTGVICALIRAMPERRWTAIKITQCSHLGGDVRQCDCGLDGCAVAVTEEQDPAAQTDTARYLAMGAVRSLWVRTLPGHLAKAMPRIEEEIARGGNVVIESNSVLEFVQPDVYALIVSQVIADFKPSARRYLERVDAILTVEAAKANESRWPEEIERRMSQVPQFSVDAVRHVSAGFFGFVRRRLSGVS